MNLNARYALHAWMTMLAGMKWRSGKAFNRLYKAMGKQAVVLMD